MSAKLAATEIQRFLQSVDPEVLCITGEWGVGKTYAWRHYLEGAMASNAVGLDAYAYISLFGQTSLADIKLSIFENTVPAQRLGAGPSIETFTAALTRASRWTANRVKSLPQVKEYAGVATSLLFASVRKQIVCIDDLERLGGGVDTRDVLGLISELREQRGCKVVLLLNREKLNDQARGSFDANVEKVADAIINFDPTPDEAVEIGLDRACAGHALLVEFLPALGVKNIRVVKRVERFAERLLQILGARDERLTRQSIQSLSLFCVSRFSPGSVPPIEYLRSYNSYHSILHDINAENVPENEKAWDSMLRAYGFGRVDDFDSVILDGVIRGFFDEERISQLADSKEAEIAQGDRGDSFSKAWDLYHGSFDLNDDEVLDALVHTAKESASVIGVTSINTTVRFLRELDRGRDASGLIQYVIENVEGSEGYWDLRRNNVVADVVDPELAERFAEKLASMSGKFSTPDEILLEIERKSGWSEYLVDRLAEFDADDFYEAFKRVRGPELHAVVKQAILFRGRGGAGSQEAGIAARATEALDRIAAESPMNARRVRQKILRM